MKELTLDRFSLRTLLILMIGLGGAMTVLTAPTASARCLGWIAVGVFLLVRRQSTLLGLHVVVPALLAVGLSAFSVLEVAFAEPTSRELWGVAQRAWAEGTLYVTLATFPLSFCGVDSG